MKKGRLSADEIQRMLDEAKRYEQEDQQQRDRVEAKNRLEAYLFQVKQSLDEHGDKLSADDKQHGLQLVNKTLEWVENNQLAEKAEYEDQLKEVQNECSKLMSKLHQQSTGQQQSPNDASCGRQFNRNSGGPTVEEVD